MMKSQDQIGVIFVNTVLARGILNGVCNLTLGAFNFTPTQEGTVEFDQVVAARLRMDRLCAKHLRDELDTLLKMIEAEEAVKMAPPMEAEAEKPTPKKVAPRVKAN